MTVNSPMGASEQVLTVNKDLTGTVSAPDLGEPMEILNATVEGQSVSFGIVFDMQGQQLEAEFKGTIDGDSISGEYITDFGNATVTGTRN